MKLEHFKYIMEVHLFLTWVYLQQNRIFCVSLWIHGCQLETAFTAH